MFDDVAIGHDQLLGKGKFADTRNREDLVGNVFE